MEIILVGLFTVPRIWKITPYVVTSGSMLPKYPIGSLIYVQQELPDKIKEGDVITFYMKNSKVVATHEVYKIDQDKKLFYTQGINNKDDKGKIIHDAEPVAFDHLIGTPIYCVPKLGFINKIITTKPWGVILITITLIIGSFLLEKIEKEGEKNGKQEK